jgi:cold shock CspA family protein
MRIGQIIKLVPNRKFGFIRTEHFREDVFFHYSILKDLPSRFLEVGQDVEFEINELLRLDEQKLEATVVQPASRSLSNKLEEEAMPEFRPAHHPKARRRKPTWKARGNTDSSEPKEAE